MTKGEYPYPPDEFDAVDPSTGPRGVHRRPRSRWSTVWPFLLALAASAGLAFVLVAFVWDERVPTTSAGATTAAPDAAASDTAPAPASPTEAAPTGPPATQAPTTPAPEMTSAPPPAPDLTTPVTVFNSTSVRGLAADAADRLEDAGWSEVRSGNYPGGTLASSTVFYASADQEVSARAVADVLGIAVVELAEGDDTSGIEVVLERDFVG